MKLFFYSFLQPGRHYCIPKVQLPDSRSPYLNQVNNCAEKHQYASGNCIDSGQTVRSSVNFQNASYNTADGKCCNAGSVQVGGCRVMVFPILLLSGTS